ncbi:3'-5' exonuclease [Nocardioides kongjuensis]
MGAVALLAWLRQQVLEARDGRGAERTRRLDSDADAVQLVTIHASKGLQYPVVYLPSLADRWVAQTADKPLFHDADGRRCLDVVNAGPDWADHVRRWKDEENGEWLRLLYVALTRAQSQVVAWWAPTSNAKASPLHRLLLRGPAPDGKGLSSVVPVDPPVPDEDAATRLFATWRDRGAFVPEVAEPATELPPLPQEPPAELGARGFTRSVDTGWRRTSYSALSHVDLGAPAPGVGSEPEIEPKDDEDLPPLVETAAPDPALALPSPMAGLPLGATFGSLVHAVLEHADPAVPDLRAELLGHIAEQLTWWPVALDPEELADALVAVLDTPLGPLMDDTTLRRVGTTDRLCELDFELPLSGGDHPVHQARSADEVLLGDIASLLRKHLPEGDPVRAYADALDNPLLGGQVLRGYLTGSIDVVLRLPSADGDPRYVVVDYKTNWLGPTDEPLTAGAYRPSALDDAMGHSDYPLQALLYAVVLHRFLRWRQPGYDPVRHLGGVAYLYLRGMCGPQTPRVDGNPCGIFTWQPPVELVVALSDLLDGAKP